MTEFDPPTLINWIVFSFVSGSIAFIFTYLAHRIQRERELDLIKKRFDQERALQQNVFNAKIDEIKQQIKQQRDDAIKHEVLPIALQRLQDAIGRSILVMPGPKETPFLDDHSPKALEEFMERMELMENHKDELRKAADKTRAFAHVVFWYDLRAAQKAREEYSNYLIYKKVYINDENLYGLFLEANTQLIDFLHAARITHDDVSDRETRLEAGKAYRESMGRLNLLVTKIEELVKEHVSS